ncbi:MAG: mannosyltransferase [Taibaiella sp.]|jgi:hypothetical protein
MKLHIISLDVPFPPDYGGMVDVFYKIKNLHEAGVKIYLHCFEYGRGEPREMSVYCEEVFYYKRKTGIKGLSFRLPYMLYSRRDEALLNNLNRIDAPILFEGVHTAYYLSHPALEGRFKLMRNQNLEQEYYALLAERETNPIKKLFYRNEAKLLRIAESKLTGADVFLTVAEHDHEFFKKLYPQKKHEYVPSFQPYNDVKSLTGTGEYVLYHGNLGHPENVEAALFLLEQVCPLSNVPFIFAGKDPDQKVIAACEKLDSCKLVANPSMQQMAQLIAEAQVHALPTFQATGLKLKLLHALFNGRHVLVNDAMVKGTGLSEVCRKAETPLSFAEKIKELMNVPFDEEEIQTRRSLLLQRYDNRRNALRIIACLPK